MIFHSPFWCEVCWCIYVKIFSQRRHYVLFISCCLRKVFHVKSTIYVNIAMQYPRACNLVTYNAKFDFGRSMRLAVGFSVGYLEALFFTTQLINIGRSFCVPFLYICPLIILCVEQVDLEFFSLLNPHLTILQGVKCILHAQWACLVLR